METRRSNIPDVLQFWMSWTAESTWPDPTACLSVLCPFNGPCTLGIAGEWMVHYLNPDVQDVKGRLMMIGPNWSFEIVSPLLPDDRHGRS
jgi:hypothetical protein